MSNGGNAVDAAVATMLCEGALCPEYMGIGGGFIMSIYNASTKKVMTIDARETAPAAATISMFVEDPMKSIYGTCYIPTCSKNNLKKPWSMWHWPNYSLMNYWGLLKRYYKPYLFQGFHSFMFQSTK